MPDPSLAELMDQADVSIDALSRISGVSVDVIQEMMSGTLDPSDDHRRSLLKGLRLPLSQKVTWLTTSTMESLGDSGDPNVAPSGYSLLEGSADEVAPNDLICIEWNGSHEWCTVVDAIHESSEVEMKISAGISIHMNEGNFIRVSRKD